MKVHPIPHAAFETTRSGFIQILPHCLVSWKITPLYFCSSNLIYFGQKEPIEVKFSDFWVVGSKFIKFLISYLKPKASFSLTFASIFSVMRRKSSVFFHLNLYMLWRKASDQSAKFQTFDCLREISPYLYFNRLSFCWKYVKFQLKKYGGVKTYDTVEWCEIWRKTLLLFQKWQKFVGILIWELKSLKNLHFDWYLSCKVCNVWPKKVQRS